MAQASAWSMLVFGSAAAGVAAPVDGVTTAVRDDAVLTRDTEHGRSLGFTGKLCTHPAQIGRVHRAYEPTADERTDAERIVATAATAMSPYSTAR